jgi:hypothetical protein
MTGAGNCRLKVINNYSTKKGEKGVKIFDE